MSFPNVLSKTMGWKDLGESYDSLFGFGITIVVDDLKCNGHQPISKHVLAIFMILPRQTLLLIINLRWDQESLSGSGANKLLHLAMAFVNYSLEKGSHSLADLSWTSSRILILIWWYWTWLKVKWRVFQRLLISRHGQLLYLMASTTGRFLFLTQFISFHGPIDLCEISCVIKRVCGQTLGRVRVRTEIEQ